MNAAVSGQAFWRTEERNRAGAIPPRCPTCGHRRIVRRGLRARTLLFVADHYGLNEEQLRSGNRHANFVEAKALVVWSLRTLGRAVPYREIGLIFGNKEHSSAIYLHQKAINLRLRDAAFNQACRDLAVFVAEENEHASH